MDGPSARVTSDELRRDGDLSESEVSRLTEILSDTLSLNNAIGNVSRQSSASQVEFSAGEHSADFAEVDTVDRFDAINHAIAQKREEEAKLSRSPWQPVGAKGKRRASALDLGATTQRKYHRVVEEASRDLLHGRHFSEAVRAALQRYELEVRRRSGLGGGRG